MTGTYRNTRPPVPDCPAPDSRELPADWNPEIPTKLRYQTCTIYRYDPEEYIDPRGISEAVDDVSIRIYIFECDDGYRWGYLYETPSLVKLKIQGGALKTRKDAVYTCITNINLLVDREDRYGSHAESLDFIEDVDSWTSGILFCERDYQDRGRAKPNQLEKAHG